MSWAFMAEGPTTRSKTTCTGCGHLDVDHEIESVVIHEEGFVPYNALKRACFFSYGTEDCDCIRPLTDDDIARLECRRLDLRDAVILIPPIVLLAIVAFSIALWR